jgi:hypothetical protein
LWVCIHSPLAQVFTYVSLITRPISLIVPILGRWNLLQNNLQKVSMSLLESVFNKSWAECTEHTLNNWIAFPLSSLIYWVSTAVQEKRSCNEKSDNVHCSLKYSINIWKYLRNNNQDNPLGIQRRIYFYTDSSQPSRLKAAVQNNKYFQIYLSFVVHTCSVLETCQYVNRVFKSQEV